MQELEILVKTFWCKQEPQNIVYLANFFFGNCAPFPVT